MLGAQQHSVHPQHALLAEELVLLAGVHVRPAEEQDQRVHKRKLQRIFHQLKAKRLPLLQTVILALTTLAVLGQCHQLQDQ